MPLFLVRRTDPYAEVVDVDAAMFRSLSCARAFPGFRWIRSYFEEGGKDSLCIYEAACHDDVRRHSEAANIPYDSIIAIGELTPASFWVPPREEHQLPGIALAG